MGSVVHLPNIKELDSQVLALRSRVSALNALTSQLMAVLVDRGILTMEDSLAVLCGAEYHGSLEGWKPDELIYQAGFNVRHYDTYSWVIEDRVEAALPTLQARDKATLQKVLQEGTG